MNPIPLPLDHRLSVEVSRISVPKLDPFLLRLLKPKHFLLKKNMVILLLELLFQIEKSHKVHRL